MSNPKFNHLNDLISSFKERKTIVGDIQCEMILENFSNTEILHVVSHFSEKTSKECVSWYRSHLKKDMKKKYTEYRKNYEYSEREKKWFKRQEENDEISNLSMF